jgi:putative ABC transport system ATP-binding protein
VEDDATAQAGEDLCMTNALTTTASAIRAVGATKVYGSGEMMVTALNDVTQEIAAGQFTAIMGPSGSGKSTLMHCLAGLDQLTSGQVFLGDIELGKLSDRQLTLLRRDRIGFVFQAFNLVPTLSALDNIKLPSTLAGTGPDQDWLDAVVETVGLSNRLGHRPAELSGGQQQRVAVARALAGKPAIVFADEPTGNLDRHAGTEVLELLRRARDEFEQTIVMVTHDPVAASCADTAFFLSDGQVAGVLDRPTAPRVLDYLKNLEG